MGGLTVSGRGLDISGRAAISEGVVVENPSATVMDDFNDGDLVEWDVVETPWATSSTHAWEGSHGVHADNASGTFSVMIALEGSLSADFAPGDVLHWVAKEVGTSEVQRLYFAKQDTTRAGNFYRWEQRLFGGTGGMDISVNVDGSYTELFDDGAPPRLPSGEWYHCYLMWDTDEIAGDPHDSDADQTGDFYIEIQDSNHVPRYTAYVDAGDTTWRDVDSNGIGFRVNDGHDFANDLLEVATDTTSYADFNPDRHFTGSGEIHFFRTADLRPIAQRGNIPGKLQFVGADEVTAARNDFCLMYRSDAGFDDTFHCAPGASGQGVDLPNHLPDGEVGRCFVRTTDVSQGEVYVGCASDGGDDNYLRVEVDWSADRLRAQEFVAGGGSEAFVVNDVGWQSDTWYEIEFDRATTLGEVTVTASVDGGSQVAQASHDLDANIEGNEGILVVGGFADGAPSYVDHWINDTQAA